MSKARKKKDNSNFLVPILFTSETVQAIDSLVQHRSQVGIADTNEYLFARGEGQNYLAGWDTLQAISKHSFEKTKTHHSHSYQEVAGNHDAVA